MSGSAVVITCEGADITQDVMVSGTWFEALAGAIPGQFEFTVKDELQTHSFVTGDEVRITVDGVPLWGGYVTNVGAKFAFPVVRTDNLAAVTQRQWVLRGVDYNVLFDRRVLRNASDYLHRLPDFDSNRFDGDLIRAELTTSFLDLPAELNAYDYVDDVVPPQDPLVEGNTGTGAWLEQGSTWRSQMEDFKLLSGAVYYILPLDDPPYTMALHYHSLETVTSAWGFSDVPNGSTTFGFRELEADEDGGSIVNDALIWGGSEWSGSGETVFAREQNSGSQDDHGRWQTAEVHFGETGYKLQSGVSARAKVIVNGAPGEVPGEGPRGLWASQWDVKLVWFSKDVPSGQHLQPGSVVPISLHVHGADSMTPLDLLLPLRSVRMTFPTLDPNGDAYVRFEGHFSLQLGDPKSLWAHIQRLERRRQSQSRYIVATASSTSTTTSYGAIYGGEPLPTPDGVETVFTLNPSSFAYIAGTTEVYVNGLLARPGVDYTESDPLSGEITFTTAPDGADELWIRCRLA